MSFVVVADSECWAHKEQHTITFDASETDQDIQRWRRGELPYVQDIRGLDANQREILMTGTCQEAWDAMFPEEED